RLLLRDHLRGDAVSHGYVPGALRDRPHAGVAGPVARDAARQGAEDRPAVADLHGGRQAGLRTDRSERVSRPAPASSAADDLRCGRGPTDPASPARAGATPAGAAPRTARTLGSLPGGTSDPRAFRCRPSAAIRRATAACARGPGRPPGTGGPHGGHIQPGAAGRRSSTTRGCAL